MGSSGGGGGGGPAPQQVRQVKYTDILGNEQIVDESAYGQTAGLNPLTAGTELNRILANPDLAKNYLGMESAGEMLYPGGRKPQQTAMTSFLGTQAQSGKVATPDPTDRRGSIDRGSPVAVPEGTVPRDGQVAVQSLQEGSFGGEVGTGSQGFGARALQAGEGNVELTLGPAGTPEQGGVPTESANPDLQQDPNMPVVTPTESVVPDVNYIVPTTERDEQAIAFNPNDPNAAYVARGPVSSNLRNRRTGWGSSIFPV